MSYLLGISGFKSIFDKANLVMNLLINYFMFLYKGNKGLLVTIFWFKL